MSDVPGSPKPSTPDEGDSVRGRRDEDLARVPDDSRSLSPSDSPCVALCSTLYDDVCRGCGRTVFEVANWVFMDESEKREVWERIRAQGFPRKRG